MNGHRPFFVLRHNVTGQTKVVPYPSWEDGMWSVILTDGSKVSALEHEEAGLPRDANSRLTWGQSERVLF